MTIEQYLFFKVIVFIVALIFALIWWIKGKMIRKAEKKAGK